jgi:RNA polymerase sigma-70 factor (ECF subfamily)
VDENQMRERLAQLGDGGYALAIQLLGNRDDAADAVQDAFHAAWRRRRSYSQKRGELRAWFLKIVRNRCLDLIRRRKIRGTEPVSLSELTSPQGSPEQHAQQRELVELVSAQLMQMPTEQREVILLRDYHDLSYAEIASVLGMASGTVMSRLHRARKELRRRMEPYL